MACHKWFLLTITSYKMNVGMLKTIKHNTLMFALHRLHRLPCALTSAKWHVTWHD